MMISTERAIQERLQKYLDGIGALLGNKRARASFAAYAIGLLSDGERKSVEPIAARACANPNTTDACQQRLLHFLNDSPWKDHDVRRYAARYGIAALVEREPIASWIIDDTGFIKQGKHSVGVQRQYTGSAGKVTNCQIGVSLSVATASEHLPIDFELYLPECWANDHARRREARIPDDVQFETKPDLALDMIRRAIANGVPRAMVLADAAYGNSTRFRNELTRLGLDYGVGIEATTKVFRIGSDGRPEAVALDVRAVGAIDALMPKRFRCVTWREGTACSLSARFSFRRVVPAHDDGTPPEARRPVLLVCEWRDDEPHPSRYHLVSAPPTMTHKQLIRRIKDRWRTERVYENLKGELGLDHFEGRRYPGWHHHVSVALSCYAFVVAERMRTPPPSSSRFDGLEDHHALSIAA